MKINNVSGPVGAYQHQSARKVPKSTDVSRPGKGDEVLLSKEAQEVRSLKDKLAQAPDVRQERIEELRRQIESGSYRVSGWDVAEKMLRAKVFDDLL